jgi:hypothetical protein
VEIESGEVSPQRAEFWNCMATLFATHCIHMYVCTYYCSRAYYYKLSLLLYVRYTPSLDSQSLEMLIRITLSFYYLCEGLVGNTVSVSYYKQVAAYI